MNDSKHRPRFPDGAPTRPAESVRLLVARLEEEQGVRWQRGERVLVEAYLVQSESR